MIREISKQKAWKILFIDNKIESKMLRKEVKRARKIFIGRKEDFLTKSPKWFRNYEAHIRFRDHPTEVELKDKAIYIDVGRYPFLKKPEFDFKLVKLYMHARD